jgi:hypothetical protein
MESVDREVVLPRTRTSVAVVRPNRERKGAGRSRRPGKDPTGGERQPRWQAAACDNERIGRSTASRCNGLAVRMAHGPVIKRRWTQGDRRKGDRDVVLPRARTPIVICRLNRECKAAGRSRRSGKDPTGNQRQSGR